MTKPMVRIVELDGTVIDREMTDDELIKHQETQTYFAAQKAEAAAKAQAKAALLAQLGITEEQAKLLLS